MIRDVHEIDWAAVIIRSAVATAPTARPKPRIVDGVAAELAAVFVHFDITTPRRQAHFIAQCIIECDYFQTLEEYASGDAYDTRTDLGNTAAKDGDGRLHKGFGIIQTTGKANQARALKKLLDLGFLVTQNVAEAKSVLTQPKYAAWGAGIWWNDNKMNAIADRDTDGSLCSRQVNRGNWRATKPANHEAERKRAFKATWKEIQNPRLLARPAVAVSVAQDLRTGRLIDPALPVSGLPIDTSGMSPEELARFNAATVGLAQSLKDNPDMEPVLGQAHSASGWVGEPAPGMDEDEHAAQVQAGEQPDAAPPSPVIPLPAEPVAPGVPEGLLRASQQRLRDRGFFGVGGADGQPAWMTVQGIAGFQAVAGLPVTGQLDKATMDAIWSDDAPSAPISLGRAMTEVKDLKGKSEIIDSAEGVKTASAWQGILAGGGATLTLAMSSFNSVWDEMAPVRAVFAEMPVWVWGIIALVVIGGPAAYSYWKAHRVQAARVTDQRTGKTA